MDASTNKLELILTFDDGNKYFTGAVNDGNLRNDIDGENIRGAWVSDALK